MTTHDCDLTIVGGGPAGLAAAINAASEGLKVCLMDLAGWFGGQALQSHAIENYPLPSGYPNGATGMQLMGGFAQQASKFGTELCTPVTAEVLETEGKRHVIRTSDYDEYISRGVVIANGLAYRRLNALGIGEFMGHGVWYGLPSGIILKGIRRAVVVGGANSAGQAVAKLASNPRTEVTMLVRSRIEKGMSSYLANRLRKLPNVHIREGEELMAVQGEEYVERALTSEGPIPTDGVFIFIGASPRTMWVRQNVRLDANKFIETRPGTAPWCPGPFATSLPGVWAVGDIRAGSVKRIASAIGEGAGVIPNVHRWIGEQT